MTISTPKSQSLVENKRRKSINRLLFLSVFISFCSLSLSWLLFILVFISTASSKYHLICVRFGRQRERERDCLEGRLGEEWGKSHHRKRYLSSSCCSCLHSVSLCDSCVPYTPLIHIQDMTLVLCDLLLSLSSCGSFCFWFLLVSLHNRFKRAEHPMQGSW